MRICSSSPSHHCWFLVQGSAFYIIVSTLQRTTIMKMVVILVQLVVVFVHIVLACWDLG